nr:L,D-transpeptidase family protein [Bacteroidota bacterium]
LILSACNKCSDKKSPAKVLVEEPEMVNEEVSKLISDKLSKIDTSKIAVMSRDSLFAIKLVAEFYSLNKFELQWTDQGKLTKQGDTLYNLIRDSEKHGLMPGDYHFPNVAGLLKYDSTEKKFDAVKLAEADILLTDAFFTFAVHLHSGRLNPDSLIREWRLEKLDTNLVVLLNKAKNTNTIHFVIDSLEPKNKPYQRLKAALTNFRIEFKDSNWDSLASRDSDSLTFNERLKQRLIASHDYLYDSLKSDSMNLVKAIKNFQCRHKLTEDGKVGKLTFKALQRTKQDYIRQIELNMERWRWTKVPHEKQYVWVNIPKYEMHVVEEDTVVMRSRVIVGAAKTNTPVLKSTIQYFLIYPYWTVPFSIATKEILPALKRDTSYLRRKNFEVLDRHGLVIDTMINWKRYNKNNFPFKLRQRIGDDNSLGILKFNFHNKYGVYLHDTDNRRLFGREMRAMSHGCVRLEKFVEFAKFMIRDDSVKYHSDSLMLDLSRPIQKYVYIKKPIAVYINYFTAEADEDGALFLFIDVYKKDERMLVALNRKKKK